MPEIACKICQNNRDNRSHVVREMMFGTRETFNYLECCNCGCLQLLDPIHDASKYYPTQYVSFIKSAPKKISLLRRFLHRKRVQQVLEANSRLGSWLLARGNPDMPAWIAKAKLKLNDRILDVGCGSGALLHSMQALGFRSLAGVDPFIDAPVHKNKIHIYKNNLESLNGSYDCIMFHHSFEHMADPLNVLQTAARLLPEGKPAIIRIPVMGKQAWKKYGVDWVAIDAPRHYFVHTEKSMGIIADKAGFTVEDITYDSFEMQFWGSEQYKRNIPLYDPKSFAVNPLESCFTADQIKEYKITAKKLNAKSDGDAACFILRRP